MNLQQAVKKLNNNFFFYVNERTKAILCSNWMLNIDGYERCIVRHKEVADLLEGSEKLYFQINQSGDFPIYELLTDSTLQHAIMGAHLSIPLVPETLYADFISMIDSLDRSDSRWEFQLALGDV